MAVAAFPADLAGAASHLAGAAASILPIPAYGDERLRGTLETAEFLVVDFGRDDVVDALASLASLRVVQVLLAGSDWIAPAVPPGVMLCTARGVRDEAVSEWVVAALTGVHSGLLSAVRNQSERSWTRVTGGELAGQRVLILGMGSIGRVLGRKLEALGTEVVGVAREAREGIRGVGELSDLLPTVDAAVVLLPLTASTAGMVDARLLARLRNGAVLVNAGRGAVIDTDALTREVASGRLMAVLDVVDPEPLPAQHPLWVLPGSYLSPHIAGATRQARERAGVFAAEQLRRFLQGDPLLNVGSS
jgi:phosphoglycerate dehydrogenase-like enzyme